MRLYYLILAVLIIFVIVLNIQILNNKSSDNISKNKITSSAVRDIINADKIIDNSSHENKTEVKFVIEEPNKRSKRSSKKSSEDSGGDNLNNQTQNPVNDTNYTQEQNNLTVTFIDVGQADSALISYKDYNILVDCGYGSQSYDYLVGNNISKIDLIVASHPDADHVRGCIKIMENLDVEFVWDNGNFRDDVVFYEDYFRLINEVGYKNVSNEDFIEFEDLKLNVVHSNMNHSSINDNSIVLRLDYFNFSVLFTGDCRFDCEEEIEEEINVDILKVGHHGSKYSSSSEFLERVNASVGVISVGSNSYGHPTQEVLDRLNILNMTVYRTDLDGNVGFVSDGGDYFRV